VRGREFQMVGAAYEKDRRPMADLMFGTTSRFWSDDRRVLEGV